MQWHNLLAACGAAAQLRSLSSSCFHFKRKFAHFCLQSVKKCAEQAGWKRMRGEEECNGCTAAKCGSLAAGMLHVITLPPARPVECACASIAFHLARREGGVGGSRKGYGCGAGCQSGWRTDAEHKDNNNNADIVAIFVACCMLQK